MKWILIKEFFIKIIFYLLPLQEQRSRFLKKHHLLAECGSPVFYQPRKLPMNPKCVKFHNNVFVAADVSFICHDVIFLMLRNMDQERHCENLGCIEVMDNCFIGMGAKIMPDVKIGPNAIVAAGSVVTKDVPEGCVVAGVPARVIGKFDDVVKKQNLMSEHVSVDNIYDQRRISEAWEHFNMIHEEQE